MRPALLSLYLFIVFFFSQNQFLRAGENQQRSLVFKQSTEYLKDSKPTLIPGVKMKKVGMGLTIAGVSCLGIGAILIATSNWQKVNTAAGTSYGTRDVKGAIGVLLCVPGIGLTIPGGIVWGVGERKTKRYRENLRKQILPAIINTNDTEKIPPQERY